MLLLSSVNFYSNVSFSNKSYSITIRVSKGLVDPDQDQYSASLHLDPNCLQRLSADYKSNR